MRPDFDDATAATGPRKSQSSGGSVARYVLSKVKTLLLLALCISLFSYAWLLYFSDRFSTRYVSHELLGARSILWVTAHREEYANQPDCRR